MDYEKVFLIKNRNFPQTLTLTHTLDYQNGTIVDYQLGRRESQWCRMETLLTFIELLTKLIRQVGFQAGVFRFYSKMCKQTAINLSSEDLEGEARECGIAAFTYFQPGISNVQWKAIKN